MKERSIAIIEVSLQCCDIREADDWYKIKNDDLLSLGGSGLLHEFEYSLPKLLNSVYPEKQWDPIKFAKSPIKFWTKLTVQRNFMDRIAHQLSILKRVI